MRLPRSEGDGVADVSFTWPRMNSISLRRGDSGYQTLFEFGYGLSY